MAKIISKVELEKLAGGAEMKQAFRYDGSGSFVIFGKPSEIDTWFEFAEKERLLQNNVGLFPGNSGSPVYVCESRDEAQRVLDRFKEYKRSLI